MVEAIKILNSWSKNLQLLRLEQINQNWDSWMSLNEVSVTTFLNNEYTFFLNKTGFNQEVNIIMW